MRVINPEEVEFHGNKIPGIDVIGQHNIKLTEIECRDFNAINALSRWLLKNTPFPGTLLTT